MPPANKKKTPAPEGARVSYCRMGEGKWGWGHHPAYAVNAQWSLAVSGTGKIFSRKCDPRDAAPPAKAGFPLTQGRVILEFQVNY